MKEKVEIMLQKTTVMRERNEAVTVVVMKIHFFLDETSCWSYEGI